MASPGDPPPESNRRDISRWLQDDELFRSECLEGHRWQRVVATYLWAHGLDVELEKPQIREHVSQRHEYLDTLDLRCNGVKFEVKSRRERFVDPASFPFDTIFVDTVSSWEGKSEKPAAYVCISRPTGAIIWTQGRDSRPWHRLRRFDKVRKITDQFFAAPRDQWEPVDSMVARLKQRARRRRT